MPTEWLKAMDCNVISDFFGKNRIVPDRCSDINKNIPRREVPNDLDENFLLVLLVDI
jgi:hypothetical protein